MLKTERIAKNFQMAFNQHFGYAKIKGILEIIIFFFSILCCGFKKISYLCSRYIKNSNRETVYKTNLLGRGTMNL